MDSSILVQAGLTQREAEVYLTLLRAQELVASEVSKKIQVNRSHVYDTLNLLIEKGLVSYVIKDGKKYFKPASPEKIIDFLHQKQKLIEQYLPALNQLYEPSKQALRVEVFEGKEGVKTVMNDMIQTNKEILCLGTTGKSQHLFPIFVEQFHKQRVEKKIPLRAIFNDDVDGIARGEKVSQIPFAKVKYMHKSSPSTTYVYGKKVLIILWEKEQLLAIMIQSSAIADSYKRYFETLWKASK